MSATDHTCGPEAERTAEGLGFSCQDANPVLTLRDPFGLENGTMVVLEVLIIAGAVFAFVHAWRRWRIDGDPVNISLWFASVVYLMVIEPPLYFPGWFGLEEHVGHIFSHNVFTVQFMYDRLPLYIVAFYPALSQLAYEVVRALGVFAQRGALAGAVAVAFVCQVFYETFDQLGPQLRWWAWNPDNLRINEPALASVPMNSMLLFASVSFGAMTWLVVRLTQPRQGRDEGRMSGPQIAWRTVVAGALTPLAMIVVSAPNGIFGGEDPQLDVLRWILGVELAVVWGVGAYLCIDGWREVRRAQSTGAVPPLPSPGFVRIYPGLYLGVHVLLWAVALPGLVSATGGLTDDGAPVGSWWYSLACILASGVLVVATRQTTRRTLAPSVAEPVRT